METSSRGTTTWASWMDDRTTTAYCPQAHAMIPRVAAPATGRLLRSAPLPAANVRSDEAGLMWLDEDDLLSVTGQSITASHSGYRLFAKCLLPALGLFIAVLFGHIILAAAGEATPTRAAASKSPRRATDTIQTTHATGAPAATAGTADRAAATAAAAASGEPTPPQREEAAPRAKGDRSQGQHYDEGAHGSGASVPSGQQPGMLRINSRPWAQVTLDGHLLGNTPLFDVQVAPGAHTLRLDNPDFRLSKTIRLDVAPGDTVTRVVSLQE